MADDIDDWNDMERMDKRTKVYKDAMAHYIKTYIEIGDEE